MFDVHVITCIVFTISITDLAECVINAWLAEMTVWLRRQIFVAFEEIAREDDRSAFSSSSASDRQHEMRKLDLDETCALLVERISGMFVLTFNVDINNGRSSRSDSHSSR